MNSLPRLYQITPEPSGPPEFDRFFAELQETLQSGVKLVQLRAKRLEMHEYMRVAQRTLDVCRAYSVRMILNGPVEMAQELGCDGIHLNSQKLLSCIKRPVPETMLLSTACHNAAQIDHSHRIGADMVTLSPVFQTNTHPEAVPLGWEKFRQIVRAARMPVFALGGMRPEMIETVNSCGAWGIATISATWRGKASIDPRFSQM